MRRGWRKNYRRATDGLRGWRPWSSAAYGSRGLVGNRARRSTRLRVFRFHQSLQLLQPFFQLGILHTQGRVFRIYFFVQPLDRRQRHAIGFLSRDALIVGARIKRRLEILRHRADVGVILSSSHL